MRETLRSRPDPTNELNRQDYLERIHDQYEIIDDERVECLADELVALRDGLSPMEVKHEVNLLVLGRALDRMAILEDR